MPRFFLLLGHGRALETYLIGAKLLMAAQMLAPGVTTQIVPLQDLYWIPDKFLSVPFLVLGLTQLVGMILNMRGWKSSWIWRSAGASIGICLWSWLITKTLLIGAVGIGSLPFWVMSFIASVFLLWRGVNRLPLSGAPGPL